MREYGIEHTAFKCTQHKDRCPYLVTCTGRGFQTRIMRIKTENKNEPKESDEK